MSRAAMIVPFKSKRVETGYLVSRPRLLRWTVEVDGDATSFTRLTEFFRDQTSRIVVELLNPRPSLLILHLTLRSAEQLTPMPIGQLAP